MAVVNDGRVETTLDRRGARCLAVDPEDPDTLYVGTSDDGLFKSEDSGRTWEKLPGIEHSRVTAAAVSPADGAVYAGTEPLALFVSRDGDASWRELEGMKHPRRRLSGASLPGPGPPTCAPSRPRTRTRTCWW